MLWSLVRTWCGQEGRRKWNGEESLSGLDFEKTRRRDRDLCKNKLGVST